LRIVGAQAVIAIGKLFDPVTDDVLEATNNRRQLMADAPVPGDGI
jgi:hypothetical protein